MAIKALKSQYGIVNIVLYLDENIFNSLIVNQMTLASSVLREF